jgi:hypothetical protein
VTTHDDRSQADAHRRTLDVVPHPALDVTVEESSPTDGRDRLVFGVPAAMGTLSEGGTSDRDARR